MAINIVDDRLETDLYNNTSKAYINATELNRIEGNIAELSTRHGLGLTTVTNWGVSDIPKQADGQRIISNVHAIAEYAKNNSDYIPPELPTTLDKATIYMLNTIEKTLADVDGLTRTAELWIEDSSDGIHPENIKWTLKSPTYASGWVTVDMSDVFVDLMFDVNGETIRQNIFAPTANIIYTFDYSAGMGDTLWFCCDYKTNKGYFKTINDPGDISHGYYEKGVWWMPIGQFYHTVTKNGNVYDVDIEYEPLNRTSQGNIHVTASYFGTIQAA